MVYHSNSQTITWSGKKESEVGLNRKTGEDVSEAKGETHKRTSVSSTKLREKNKNKS